jgi:UDP-N-acetylmuramate dehydrogenase
LTVPSYAIHFNKEEAYRQLQHRFAERVKLNELLAQHSTFGVGGPADIWLTLNSHEELVGLVSLCAEKHWPLLLIGNGSNIIFTDAGERGIVAKIAAHGYEITRDSDGTALLSARAGSNWSQLAIELAQLGWGGLEFGVGIPGTMGAGMISNAGAHNRDLGQVLEWIEVLDARGSNLEREGLSLPITRRYMKDELDLRYRYSRLRAGHESVINQQGEILPVPRGLIEPAEIVTTLGLRLHQEAPHMLAEHIKAYRQARHNLEPVQRYTGSIFKDAGDKKASDLIEQAGLKNFTIGKASISDHDTNYIVNQGGATTSDIINLIKEAHRRVKERFNISLELNVEIRGA